MRRLNVDLKALGYRSGTMKAFKDNMRAIDLLAGMEEVSPGGVAVLGQSLGGHNAIYTAVYDARIKVVASSCSIPPVRVRRQSDGDASRLRTRLSAPGT